MRNIQVLDQKKLKEMVHYNPETGVFKRIKSKQKSKIDIISVSMNPKGYLQMTVCGKNYMQHRLAWLYMFGFWPTFQIDHIDHNKSNNRINNLRDATGSQNCQNIGKARSHNICGLLGVSFSAKKNMYRARINANGKVKYIGVFKDAEQAHAAYLEVKKILHPYSQVVGNFK